MIRKNNISRQVICPIAMWLAAIVVVTVWLLYSPVSSAEFYARRDHLGRTHLSNLPPRSFDHNGEIRRAYDPNSIVYQHAKMLEALADQSAEIAQAQEQEAREIENKAAVLGALKAPPARGLPREGNMNLDELIALEKRGGRWQPGIEERP